jgi:PIN domain nuclease of toxin-antitoxin system
VRLLLDTHVVLWWLQGGDTLAPAARTAISDPSTEVWVSAASAWEISIKSALGRLRGVPDDLSKALEVHAFTELPVGFDHAREAGALPAHHADPFDRMLIAQARIERLTLCTRDHEMTPYRVRRLVA